MRALRVSAIFATILVAGCAVRARPYRFNGPMVAGAELGAPIWNGEPAPMPSSVVRRPSSEEIRPRTSVEPAISIRTTDDGRRTTDGRTTSLPAPHRDARPRRGEPAAVLAVPPAAAMTIDSVKALAGVRDGRAPLDFALDLRARLVGDRWDADDGPELVEEAARRELLGDARARIAPGALLVFDRAVERKPASLVAVALATDDRGVTTMIFLAAGVVRIGAVDPAHPAVKRDASGAIRNTFLRHREEEPPPGTHFLAGELLAHVIAPP